MLSGVVGVALFSKISWLEIHKLSNLLPYFRLTHQDRSICFAHRWASANHNEDDVTLMSRALKTYWHRTCTPSLSLKFTAYLLAFDVFVSLTYMTYMSSLVLEGLDFKKLLEVQAVADLERVPCCPELIQIFQKQHFLLLNSTVKRNSLP